MVEVASFLEQLCQNESVHGTVGTIGRVNLSPNAINVIPGICSFSLDIRSVDDESLKRTVGNTFDKIIAVCEQRDLSFSVEQLMEGTPQPLDQKLVNNFAETATDLRIGHMIINSGAAHDAMNMARHVPTVMLFMPSHRGISHNSDEFTDMDDVWNCVLMMREFYKNT